MRTARRWPIGRGRPGHRLLAVVAIAAITMGCVADTSSATRPEAAPADGGVAPAATAASLGPTTEPASPAAPSVAAAPTPRPFAAGPYADANVPILYYHHVRPLPTDYPGWSTASKLRFTTYDTLPSAFAAQLDWLKAHGYTTILPRDLIAYWDDGGHLPVRPVIISFDDGSRDWVTRVLPMLQAHGMVAEFYLTLDAIAHGNLTWPEVRRLAAAGNGIGAHDVHHVQLTGMGGNHASASEATMWTEVSEARRIIGLNVGIYPDSMAYVGGGYDATLEGLVREAGYTSARSINRGDVQDPNRRYRLRIVRIGVHDDVADLLTGALVPGLPTFTARMAGVPDK